MRLICRFGYVPRPANLSPCGEAAARLHPDADAPSSRRRWRAIGIARISVRGLRQAGIWARRWQDAVASWRPLLRYSGSDGLSRRAAAGALLSGCIDCRRPDVALMQAQSARPVKTFSIGLPRGRLRLSGACRPGRRHLGCDHTEL